MNLLHWILNWFKTRPYRQLWRSLPALMTVAACLVFGLALLSWSAAKTSSQYATVVDRALVRHDFKTARIASMRRLALKNSPRPEVLFKLAESLDGLGQRQEAFALINSLAPEDNQGYAPAHLIVAESLLRTPKLTAPVIRAVELHLVEACQQEPHSPVAISILKYLYLQLRSWEAGTTNRLSLDPKSLETHEVAGWVFFQAHDWPAAKPHLIAESAENPTVFFMLADMATASGDPAGARHWNQQAEHVYHAKVAGEPDDVPADRLPWVQAEMRLGQFDTARQILINGQKLSGTNVYALALGELYAAWVQQLVQIEPHNLAARLQYIQLGLAADSVSSPLLLQLSALSRLKGPEAQTAREDLDQLLADGPLVPLRLCVLGAAAWQQGDQKTALAYMGRAYQQAPTQPDIANNMALMLAQSDQPNLARALEIIQSLLNKYPDQPHYRDTRGQIYVQMGRYEDGVRDLEFALPRLNNPQSTLKALGRAYRLFYASHPDKKFMDIAIHYEKLAAGGK